MKRCPVLSSVTGEQCRDVDSHREYDANRFHRFKGAVGSNEKRLAHMWWHEHVNRCAECRGASEMCDEGESRWQAMAAHGCTFKSWCAREDDHGVECVPLDELEAAATPADRVKGGGNDGR